MFKFPGLVLWMKPDSISHLSLDNHEGIDPVIRPVDFLIFASSIHCSSFTNSFCSLKGTFLHLCTIGAALSRRMCFPGSCPNPSYFEVIILHSSASFSTAHTSLIIFRSTHVLFDRSDLDTSLEK